MFNKSSLALFATHHRSWDILAWYAQTYIDRSISLEFSAHNWTRTQQRKRRGGENQQHGSKERKTVIHIRGKNVQIFYEHRWLVWLNAGAAMQQGSKWEEPCIIHRWKYKKAVVWHWRGENKCNIFVPFRRGEITGCVCAHLVLVILQACYHWLYLCSFLFPPFFIVIMWRFLQSQQLQLIEEVRRNIISFLIRVSQPLRWIDNFSLYIISFPPR